ncbi:SGNH hydrolase-type esterase domain [Trinorchestia longiramus]|nr:SGNH hydrolase-type esterase domain [Trinorchestia longiramus]
MPTASMKAETNGITDSNDPLDRIQNEIASRLSELALKKEELDNDSAHPRARFYKNLSKDVIQYKKLSPDQLNHLREMDATYSTLDAVKEISEIVNECLNEHRTRFKKQQKKASQDKAREIFERVKEVLKIQSSLELAVTHPQLFLEPLSQEHPATSTELLEKLQRIHGLITPPRVTDCTKSIAITQISAEHNPQQIQSHTQPAGILKTIPKANKITNINLQNFDGNKRTTKEKTKNRKKRHVFLIGDSIIKGQKTEFKRGLNEHKILCRPKIQLPEAVHLVEDLRCKKEDIVIVLCGTRELEHKTQDEISLQFEALIHTVKNKSKNAIITSILPRRNDVNLNPQILLTNEKVKEICAEKGVMYLDLMSHFTGQERWNPSE